MNIEIVFGLHRLTISWKQLRNHSYIEIKFDLNDLNFNQIGFCLTRFETNKQI